MGKRLSSIEIEHFDLGAKHHYLWEITHIAAEPSQEDLCRFDTDLFHPLRRGIMGVPKKRRIAQVVEGAKDQVAADGGWDILKGICGTADMERVVCDDICIGRIF